MAYVGSTNNVGTGTVGGAFYYLKLALKLAGWTVVSSGNGSTVTNTDQLGSVAAFQAAGAWARLREPGGGTREYVFQNVVLNGNANSAIIKYSRATGFNTGGTGPTMPTTGNGGDGVVFVGGGTDSAPTPAASILPSNNPGGAYYQAVASDTPVNGVYGWWWFGYVAGTAGSLTLIGTEAIAAGSTPSNDADPSVRYVGPFASYLSSAVNSSTGSWQWWEAYGLGGATYRTSGFAALYIAYTTAGAVYSNQWPAFTGLDPYQGKIAMLPVLVGKGTTCLPKGFTTSIASFGVTQNLLDTFNLSSSEPKVCVNISSPWAFAVPWITNLVPLV